MNFDGIGLIVTLCMGRHTGLGGLPGGGIYEEVARSLKMNVDRTACRDANMGRSFPI